MTVLTRTKVLHLKRGQAPYRKVNGKWVTNATPVYAKRTREGKVIPAVVLTPGPTTTAAMTNAELERARTTAERYGWTLIERDATMTINRLPHLEGDLDCDPDLLDALECVAVRLSKRHGRRIIILVRSGKRTIDEQWSLFNLNMRWDARAGKWVRKAGRPLTAYPSTTAPHVVGRAADCGIEGLDLADFPGAADACHAEGVGFPVASEDWHAELTPNMAGASS